jgi:hypothetical protein
MINNWELRPGCVLGGDNRHPLIRSFAYLAGLRAHYFLKSEKSNRKSESPSKHLRFLHGFQNELSLRLLGTTNSVGLFDELMRLSNNDEDEAFKLFMSHLRSAAAEKKLI